MRLCDPLLPVLADEFGTSLSAAAATTTGFALAYGGAQLAFGALGDRFSRLAVIVVAMTAAGLATVASALAPTLDLLVAARVATGAFAAAAIPLSLAWIGDNVPFAGRQLVLARYLVGQMLGMTAGQVGAGVLAELLGWRAAFWLIALLFAVAVLMLQGPARHDAARATRAPGGLLAHTRRLLRDRWAMVVIGTVTLEGTILFGAVALVASYLQREFGVSPATAGTVSALFGLGGLLYAFNARRLLVRLQPAGLSRLGGIVFALAMLVLIVQRRWEPAILASLAAGLGYYMLHNTLQTQATQLSTEARAAALAWFASGLWIGQGIGVTATAAVAERIGFVPVFGAAAVALAVLGAAFGRAVARRHPVRADPG
ncbi:MAG: MFS transporter [Burkholderiaceae bacterium]|nr:MFS transporter [Burkholderiaceae bacterium]